MASPRLLLWQPLLLVLASASGSVSLQAGSPDPEGEAFFEKKVRPVLAQHCYRCHAATAKKVRGGLLLDSREALLRGGESGPALVPGRPEQSRLIEAVQYTAIELQMPPRGKLPESAIADLTAWVKRGAPWPQSAAGAGKKLTGSLDLRERKREHWAWQPIHAGPVPVPRRSAWARNDVDRFILARLEEKGLRPATEAERHTLLRRVSFALTGLPPRTEEVEAYLHDESPDAYERVVDRLLASPHFGERWGRHWLDLVRYAESRGHEFDYTAPNAYQYRDYVIRAFNADLPYNQFVTEQIAGDLMPRPRLHPREGFNESILGTGFWLLGEELHSPVDVRQDEADRLDNMVDVLGKSFLGLTIACARCHDHKFDAISQKDYYSLLGFLESSSYRLARFDTQQQERRIARELARLRDRSRAELSRALAEGLQPGIERTADYLLAAREVLLAGSGSEPAQVAGCAAAHKLDRERLSRWVAQLRASAADPTDALHPIARILADPQAAASRRRGDLLQQILAAGAVQDRRSIVVDYAHPGPEGWLPDGMAFGLAPVQPGDVRLKSELGQTRIRLIDCAAAEMDLAFQGCAEAVAPGTENDPAALGRLVRAGRTIRTPSFRLSGGKVFFRVRGNGFVYAAVQSHRLIAGPLHGRVTRDIKAGPRLHWEELDLGPYKGERVHLEFTSTDDSFAVASVAQGTQKPTEEMASELVLHLLRGEDAASLAGLAGGCERLLQQTVRRLGEDDIRGKDDAGDVARLAGWISGHGELFGVEGGQSPRALEAAGRVLAEQNRLAAETRRPSRLAMALMDGSGWDEHVFVRGAPRAHGALAPRRFLEALSGPEPMQISKGSGRLELARQMTDPQRNPLLARVLVNRVWHHLFGRGIVVSTDNFGVLGERPTHPELLDWLADRFIQEGWSIKKLIRLVVLSSTYRMASQPGAADGTDADNRLLQHVPLRRLEGEAIRDAMLCVAGRLNPSLYGPPIGVHLPLLDQARGQPANGPLDGNGRRSIYLSVRRNFLSPMLLAFDTPTPFSSMGRRAVSNVPAQALILLNDEFVHQQAQRWAEQVLAQRGDERQRITRMYRAAFARPPRAEEIAACLDFLQQARQSGKRPDDPAVWSDLAHVLFNVKEFIFLQ